MFVGRESELRALERLYGKDDFQMVVIYGRRRVGKTALLNRFSQGKRVVFFTAQQKSRVHNLEAFSREVYRVFDLPEQTGSFTSWDAAFSYIAGELRDSAEKTLLVLDEFPYAAESDPSLPSVLQVAIDRELKQSNILLALCGSNESFMESEVLGRKSPLYGRRTSQIKLTPLDYRDMAEMIPNASVQDKVRYYATVGGTPYYVEQIDDRATYEDNVSALFFDISGLLYEEPLMLLRQELREPAMYNSILDAIGHGANKPKKIAEAAGIAPDSTSKYLSTLRALGIVDKKVPFGESSATSRKGIYVFSDPLFSYWYNFVSRNVGAIEAGAGWEIARATAFGDRLSTYLGSQFEAICMQWLIRRNREGKLPFIATSFGKWWGPNPEKREQDDIDVVVANPQERCVILGECKWRNEFDETRAIRELTSRAPLMRGYERLAFCLFSKYKTRASTRSKSGKRGDLLFVCADDLYDPDFDGRLDLEPSR